MRPKCGHADADATAPPGDGRASKAALAAMIDGRDLPCEHVDADPRRSGFQARDPYRRIVARCWVRGRDVGAEMLRRGFAVRWPPD
ncbi:thermonuclease family protein [Sphingomonas baiyangensis]|uniref:thermonuclease family protein n=1 Tax=Sphingomonas baiyangensis TaxID=2572576 RepID=UPI002016685C|nr:hypothetical protein [Sphingomonas baiyangensis]